MLEASIWSRAFQRERQKRKRVGRSLQCQKSAHTYLSFAIDQSIICARLRITEWGR